MNTTSNLFRGLCLASVLMAGSCTGISNDGTGPMLDGAVNHPITVEPNYQSMKLGWSSAGLTSADQRDLDSFVADYLAHGNGSIAVSAPAGPGSQNVIQFVARRINEMGVSRDHILVATHDTPNGDMRVELNYVSYQARTDTCGDWSENLAFTMDNLTSRNFGCSVQQNIAAMVADPRDLLAPRTMDNSSANRRATVLTNYQQGKITQADKNVSAKGNEQSGTSSSVSN